MIRHTRSALPALSLSHMSTKVDTWSGSSAQRNSIVGYSNSGIVRGRLRIISRIDRLAHGNPGDTKPMWGTEFPSSA